MVNDDKSRRPNLQIYSFFPQLLFQLAPLGPQERPGRCAGGSARIAIQKAVSSNSVDEALGGIATKLAILTNVGSC